VHRRDHARRIPQVRGKGPLARAPLPGRQGPAPNEDEAIQVLEGVRERYEKFHAVSYTDEAIRYAVYLSSRYIPDRFLPDKAIDLIDEAGARVKLRQATLPEEVAKCRSA
jgi:ATP-dependent Clp protease ATP-binding subunit ClpA